MWVECMIEATRRTKTEAGFATPRDIESLWYRRSLAPASPAARARDGLERVARRATAEMPVHTEAQRDRRQDAVENVVAVSRRHAVELIISAENPGRYVLRMSHREPDRVERTCELLVRELSGDPLVRVTFGRFDLFERGRELPYRRGEVVGDGLGRRALVAREAGSARST
jgi:hypothetical protein